MTILSAINEVCDVVGLDRFDSVYGSGDPRAMTMLSLARIGGKSISQRFEWRALERSTVINVAPRPLPDDYDRLIEGAAVIASDRDFFRPVKNRAQWEVIKAAGSAQKFFYISGQTLDFEPRPISIGGYFLYQSKNWIVTDAGAGREDWTSDDDRPVFPENLLVLDLIWRWKRQNGLSYNDPLAEFEAALATETEEDRA